MLDKRRASDTQTPNNGLANTLYMRTAMSHEYVILMSPNKGETAGHDCHCPGEMAVRMLEVLVRPWVSVGWCPYLTSFMFDICLFYGGTTF